MKTIILVGCYLFAAVFANLSSYYFGPSASIINAFLFIGFDLVSRDSLHEAWKNNRLFLRMSALILSGSLLSYIIVPGSGMIAFASAVSFLASGFIDFGSYHALRKKSYLIKVNGSNVFSSLSDSVIFPTLAFGSFMPLIVIGQFAAKMMGGFIFSLILRRRK